MRIPSIGAMFGLGGLPPHIQRGLVVAFSTSIASVMGSQLVFPVLPPMMEQLAVSESAIGLVVSVYSIPMIFLAPLAGAIADLHGRRPLLFGGLLLFGLAGVAASFEWVLVLRALQGIGATAILPLTIVLLSDLVSGHQESGAQGMKVFLDRIGIFLIPLLAGLLAVVSWRLPFLLFALAVP